MRTLLGLGSILVLAAPAAAQFPPPPDEQIKQWSWPSATQQAVEQAQEQRRSEAQYQALTPRTRWQSRFDRTRRRRSTRDVFPEAQAFPTFSARLPGFTGRTTIGMPVPFGADDLPGEIGVAPPRDPNAWPSWIAVDSEVRAEEGFLPDRAILVRTAERVWYLEPGASAYVPLPFYDKLRLVNAGGQIQVRRHGEFWIVFHGGALLRSNGRVSLVVEELTEDEIHVHLVEHTRVWFRGRDRTVTVTLRSGERVTMNQTEAYFEYHDERMSVKHGGPGTLSVDGPAGTVDVPAAHRIELLAGMDGSPPPTAELSVDGDVASIADGPILRAEAGAGGGVVVWNGAKFAVEPGAVLRIDPLGGDFFPDHRTP